MRNSKIIIQNRSSTSRGRKYFEFEIETDSIVGNNFMTVLLKMCQKKKIKKLKKLLKPDNVHPASKIHSVILAYPM